MNEQRCDHGPPLILPQHDLVIESYAACCLRCHLDILVMVRFERRVSEAVTGGPQ